MISLLSRLFLDPVDSLYFNSIQKMTLSFKQEAFGAFIPLDPTRLDKRYVVVCLCCSFSSVETQHRSCSRRLP
jgi:hypothetical protein